MRSHGIIRSFFGNSSRIHKSTRRARQAVTVAALAEHVEALLGIAVHRDGPERRPGDEVGIEADRDHVLAPAGPEHTRPPARLAASSTSTDLPSRLNSRAAVRPAKPAPTTTIRGRDMCSPLLLRIGGRDVLRGCGPLDAGVPTSPLPNVRARGSIRRVPTRVVPGPLSAVGPPPQRHTGTSPGQNPLLGS